MVIGPCVGCRSRTSTAQTDGSCRMRSAAALSPCSLSVQAGSVTTAVASTSTAARLRCTSGSCAARETWSSTPSSTSAGSTMPTTMAASTVARIDSEGQRSFIVASARLRRQRLVDARQPGVGHGAVAVQVPRLAGRDVGEGHACAAPWRRRRPPGAAPALLRARRSSSRRGRPAACAASAASRRWSWRRRRLHGDQAVELRAVGIAFLHQQRVAGQRHRFGAAQARSQRAVAARQRAERPVAVQRLAELAERGTLGIAEPADAAVQARRLPG